MVGVALVAFVAAYTLLLTIGMLGAIGGYWLARLLGERLPRRVLMVEPSHNLMTSRPPLPTVTSPGRCCRRAAPAKGLVANYGLRRLYWR